MRQQDITTTKDDQEQWRRTAWLWARVLGRGIGGCFFWISCYYVSAEGNSTLVLFLWHTHDDVIKRKHFRVTGPLCGGFVGHRWIPLTKASDAELWCFWSAPEQTSKQSRRRWFETPSCSLQHQCNVVLEIRWTMRSQITPNKLPIGYHHHYGHNHHLRIYNLTKTHSGRSPGVVIHPLGLSWIRLSRDVFY